MVCDIVWKNLINWERARLAGGACELNRMNIYIESLCTSQRTTEDLNVTDWSTEKSSVGHLFDVPSQCFKCSRGYPIVFTLFNPAYVLYAGSWLMACCYCFCCCLLFICPSSLWCSISMFQMLCKDWLKRLKWTPRWVLQFISTGWRLKPKRHACRATQTKGATVGARGATITTRAAGVTTKTEETTTTTTTGTGAPQLKQKGHQ